MEFVQRNILLKRGGGLEPKYLLDNIRTQYLYINKDNQTEDIWDITYAKYLVDLEIIEAQFEWQDPVTFDDLRVIVEFPSRLRPVEVYQPQPRNAVVVFTEPIIGLNTVTTKTYQDTSDRPQIETKKPREQSGVKKLVLSVSEYPPSTNTITDWAILIKIRYVDESQ